MYAREEGKRVWDKQVKGERKGEGVGKVREKCETGQTGRGGRRGWKEGRRVPENMELVACSFIQDNLHKNPMRIK